MTRTTILAAAAALAAPTLALADCAADIDAFLAAPGHGDALGAVDEQGQAVFRREIGIARAFAATEKDDLCREVLGGAASILRNDDLADIITGYGMESGAGMAVDPSDEVEVTPEPPADGAEPAA